MGSLHKISRPASSKAPLPPHVSPSLINTECTNSQVEKSPIPAVLLNRKFCTVGQYYSRNRPTGEILGLYAAGGNNYFRLNSRFYRSFMLPCSASPQKERIAKSQFSQGHVHTGQNPSSRKRSIYTRYFTHVTAGYQTGNSHLVELPAFL